MKNFTLIAFLVLNYSVLAQTNLVTNGSFEQYNCSSCTPNFWSSASDFGDFSQNTTDFTEGSSSVLFEPQFDDLFMFTTADIPLVAGTTYYVKFDYKYLGSDFDANDNIEFKIISTPTVSNPFVHNVNITNSNWNVVETSFTPTISDPDYAIEIKVMPSFSSFEYPVLFDDVQIIDAATLATINYNIKDNVFVLNLGNNTFKINTSANTIITKASVISIIGQKQPFQLNKETSVLNLSQLSKGLYIIKISTSKGQVSKKVLVN